MVVDVKHRLNLLRAWIRRDPATPPPGWLHRRWPWAVLGVALLATAALDSWLLTCGYVGCPSASEIRAFKPAEGGEILDRNNRFLGRIAVVRRVNVPLAAVPGHVRQAFIATEDRRFYEHNGLDWRGFFRSIVRNVASLGFRQGFSTITMQVAENAFLLDRYNKRSLRRKLLELRYARLLESQLSKDQILEHYLNVIYLGNGMYGVEAASRDLFGKPISRVSLTEGALLAGLPKAPSSYTPRRSERRARQRRAVVLGLMAEAGFISRDLATRAAGEPLRISEEEWRPSTANDVLALDVVRAFVDSVLPDVLKEGDVRVYTTLDYNLQRSADRTVIRHAQALGKNMQGALVALDPQSGDIRAVVAGRRTLRGGFNRAYHARRQPGSAFKPFVYAAALATPNMSSWSLVDDEPLEVDMGNGQVWQPANFDDSYMGRVTFRRALAHSLNAATIRVSNAVTEENVIAMARRNGIESPLRPVPSIALGALEVTPLELVTAYAPFANGGVRVTPRLVRRIEAPDGKVLWSREVERQPVIDPRLAYEMTSMLRAVVDYGSGRAVRDVLGPAVPVAGKTGTTNSGTDVWFVGYTPTLVAGIWFGYDQPRPINGGSASGGRIAAPAWAEFYARGWREPRTGGWYVPDNMVMRVIDPQTGELANEWCPARQREFFRPGHEPIHLCREHSSPPLWQVEEPGDIHDDPSAPSQRDDPWTQDVRREIGRVFRRIIRF